MKKNMKFLLTALLTLGFGLTACNHSGSTGKDLSGNNKLVTSVSLSSTYEQMEIGDSLQLVPEITYRNDEVVEVEQKWLSSMPNVAKVSDTGYVEAVGSGTAFITFRAGYKQAKCEIYVPSVEPIDPPGPIDPPDPDKLVITLSATSRTLDIGGTFSVTATASKAAEISWKVSDSSIISITDFTSSACAIKAVESGEADLIAYSGDVEAKCHIVVLSGGEEDPEKEYTIYFYIDYNNVDPKDDTKLLAKFDWYYDRPFVESGEVPTVTDSMALDPAFPYFIGWSTHPIIDTKENLWDLSKDTVADLPMVSYNVILYGQWLDVPVLNAQER